LISNLAGRSELGGGLLDGIVFVISLAGGIVILKISLDPPFLKKGEVEILPLP
jgi:hypothetical protein